MSGALRVVGTRVLVEDLGDDGWLAGDLAGGPPVRVELTAVADAPTAEALIEAVRARRLVGRPGLDAGLDAVVDVGREGDEAWVAIAGPDAVPLDALLADAAAAGVAVPAELVAAIAARACRALHRLHTRLDGDGRPLGLALGDVRATRLRLGGDGTVTVDTRGLAPGDAAADVASLSRTVRDALAAPAVSGALGERVTSVLAGGALKTARAVGDLLHEEVLRRAPAEAWAESLAGLVARVEGATLDRRRDAVAEAVRRLRDAARLEARQRAEAAAAAVRWARLRGAAGVGVLALAGVGVGVAALGSVAAEPPSLVHAEAGTVALHLTPAARVLLDGQPRGEGEQVELTGLSPGRHALRVEAPEHEAWATEVPVLAGATTRVDHALERIPDVPPARLHVESLPYGATVLVDGSPVGVTPLTWSTERVGRQVTVTVRKPGFVDQKRSVKLASGRKADVQVVLSPP
jgi:hypothetical protein